MKRILLFVALMAMLAVSVASAGQTYSYRWIGPLTLRTNIDAGLGVETDSTTFYVPNAADVQDTFAVVAMPSDFCRATDIDSIPEFILRAVRSVAGASGDTLYGCVQPTMDGTQFTEPSWLPPAATGQVIIEGVATGGAKPFRLATAYAQSTNWFNVAPRSGVAGVRVRLYWDGNGGTATGGTCKVYLGYLTNIVNTRTQGE